MLRRIAFEFVVDLVLQAGPEIHGYSPDLDLDLGVRNAVRQIYGHCHQHVVTLVAAGLRIDDVVLNGDDLDITLVADHLRDLVDIR